MKLPIPTLTHTGYFRLFSFIDKLTDQKCMDSDILISACDSHLGPVLLTGRVK